MEDLIYVVAIIAFFAVAVLFVTACDRIIGPDEEALAEEAGAEATSEPSLEQAA